MVRREGFEPPTHALEGHCSIQLSYRRTRIFTAEHRKNQKAAYYRVSSTSSTSRPVIVPHQLRQFAKERANALA